MKKRLLSILLLCCMVLTLLPTAAFAEGSTEELPVCTCETACMAESMNDDCSVCGAEGASAENCAKYADSVNGEGSGTGTSRQALTNVAITFPTPEAGKPVGDGSAVSANADSGLTLYLFGPALWKQGEEPDKLDENAAYAEGNTYLLNFTFYTQKPITDETVLTYNGKPITRYADYQALTEALDAYDGKQDAYLGCVLFSAEGTGDPAMEDLKDLYLLSLYAFVRVPEAQIPEDTVDEQFTLTPGGRYYFDLSAMNIPGTVNGNLPDSTLRYVPFTYAGTVNAYKLTTEMATTEEYAQKNKYPHSLFVADYAVTNDVSWDALNTADLIFSKNYASGGVDYTLRTPSAGSDCTGLDDSQRGVPQSNEWDTMLNKDSGYIQNWNGMFSWGQDVSSGGASSRAVRGYTSARYWDYYNATFSNPFVGFRPVLEVLNPDELGADALKAVTLDLGGGKLGGSTDAIQIIVKNGSTFTAPMSGGLTRPDGNTGSYFMWLGSNGKLYAPGASVPADVTNLTAQFALSEQFSLTPGGRYYFDLSAMNIPGKVNGGLPDSTLHYVPFTYAGTIEAYKLTSEMATTEEYAQKNKCPHSLFVADYAVTHTVSWDDLNTAGLIFGKDYAAGGVGYTLRAPSCGSGFTDSGDSERGTPQSNEWDAVLNKNSGYIQNWNQMYSWGQDAYFGNASYRAVRGYNSARFWDSNNATFSSPYVGFRPVLEVLNSDTLGSGGLKVVTLDLGGGKLGGSSEDIQIIVKTGSEFTAPASDGLTRPDGNTGSYFMWLGSNGKLYAPGASVPADVTKLTAQFALSEQFSLTPGGTYYFDLSGASIPGTANSGNSVGAASLPDTSLHYVPFTYAGTIEAYKLTSAIETTEGYAQQNKYAHSLFVADYAVTHTVSWNDLNTAGLIFGKDYVAGGVDYTLRAPSCGSGFTGSDDSERGTPQSNEWDAVLDKNSGYVKNWNDIYSWGQDTTRYDSSSRAVRGYNSARFWHYDNATSSNPNVGFRPVLEVLNPDTLDSDGLKVVTLDLGGGTLGNSSEDIQIIVKTGSEFTAPASDGMTRPDGDTGNFFMWRGSNGKFYVPGDSVPADVTALTVQWTAPTYTVTLNTNGGTINSGNVTGYTYGVGATLPTAGDMTYTGHTFKGWYDNENLTGSPVTAIGGTEMGNKEYWAKWEINQYTITYDLDGGTAAEGNPDSYTVETDAFTLKNPTRPGFTFTGWSGTGLTGEDNLTVTIQKGSTGNRSYTAHWRYNGGGSSGYSYYTIKATAGTGGSISPSGSISVREGRDQTFTITPDKGYAVANVKIDGKSIGAVKSYTFENVRRTHTIEVIFMKANGNPQTGVFVDVATGSYYEDAVDWAVENGITKGTDDTHFSPDGICTRAQAVTFLWRAAGSPKPETRTMPFADVPAGSYYYDAVLWAVENGITKGTSDTTFSPNMTCSRAQIVTFLWRSEKSPAAGTANPFADVKSTAYYAGAVLWAVREDITKGTTSTTFSPDADCTRAQIVTFLWRCKK
ncbi:S-layer homology domain-containing protein [Dysosmobacter welbionis]